MSVVFDLGYEIEFDTIPVGSPNHITPVLKFSANADHSQSIEIFDENFNVELLLAKEDCIALLEYLKTYLEEKNV